MISNAETRRDAFLEAMALQEKEQKKQKSGYISPETEEDLHSMVQGMSILADVKKMDTKYSWEEAEDDPGGEEQAEHFTID